MRDVERSAVLVGLLQKLAEQRSWCGEIHVQKTAYFLQEMLGVPLGVEFILYKHGPFSFDLNGEISGMLAEQHVRLEPRVPGYGPAIVPTEQGIRLRDRFSDAPAKFADQTTFVANELGSKNVAELERLATALYVTRRLLPDGDVVARAKKIVELKPHITLEQARTAVDEVDTLVDESKSLVVEGTDA